MIKFFKNIVRRIKRFPIGGTRGQALGLVALLLIVFYLSAIVLMNVGWYYNMKIRVQTALDAAALADANVKVTLLNAIITMDNIMTRLGADVLVIIGAIFGADPTKTIKAMDAAAQAFALLDMPLSVAIGELSYKRSIKRNSNPKDPWPVLTSSVLKHLMPVQNWLKVCKLGDFSMSIAEKNPNGDSPCDWADGDDEIASSYKGTYDIYGPKAVYEAIYVGGDAPFAGKMFGLKVPKTIMFSKAVPYGGNKHHGGTWAVQNWGLRKSWGRALDRIHIAGGLCYFDGAKIVECGLLEGTTSGAANPNPSND